MQSKQFNLPLTQRDSVLLTPYPVIPVCLAPFPGFFLWRLNRTKRAAHAAPPAKHAPAAASAARGQRDDSPAGSVLENDQHRNIICSWKNTSYKLQNIPEDNDYIRKLSLQNILVTYFGGLWISSGSMCNVKGWLKGPLPPPVMAETRATYFPPADKLLITTDNVVALSVICPKILLVALLLIWIWKKKYMNE